MALYKLAAQIAKYMPALSRSKNRTQPASFVTPTAFLFDGNWASNYCLFKTKVASCVPRGLSLCRLIVSILPSADSDILSTVVALNSFP